MKIAFLTPEYPHKNTGHSGGIGTSIKSLAAGLSNLGCEVMVLVYGQSDAGVFRDGHIEVRKIRNVKLKGISWWLTRKKLQRIINGLHKKGALDLIEAPDWTGITSFINCGCPVVVRENGSDTYFCHIESRPVKWRNQFHEERAIRRADGLIAVSRFTGELSHRLFGLNKAFTVIPNGIDTAHFAPSSTGSETETILYFGSLIRKKGLLELPLIFNEVVRRKSSARLLLLGKDVPDVTTGDSSTWSLMEPLFSAEARQRVTYLGAVPFAEVRQEIEKAAVCVFPSFAEAFPLSWLEAMAMEKAVVASSVGWAPEMIADGVEGFLVHPTRHAAFAERILQILDNPALAQQMGKAARARVLRDFDKQIVASKSLEYYKSCLEKFSTKHH